MGRSHDEGRVIRTGKTNAAHESPFAFIELNEDDTGPLIYSFQGAVSRTLTLTEGDYYLRGDAYAEANANTGGNTSSNATASFSVTMTVAP